MGMKLGVGGVLVGGVFALVVRSQGLQSPASPEVLSDGLNPKALPRLEGRNAPAADHEADRETQEAENREVRDAFQHAGWKPVSVPEPDPDLLALSPRLRGAREPELRTQLRTAALAGDALKAATGWLLDSTVEPATRSAALEAVIRAGDSEVAQAALAQLARAEDANSELSNQALGALLPRTPEDAAARALVEVLNTEAASVARREQAAFSLALWLTREPGLTPQIQARVASDSARSLLLKMQERIQKGSG